MKHSILKVNFKVIQQIFPFPPLKRHILQEHQIDTNTHLINMMRHYE